MPTGGNPQCQSGLARASSGIDDRREVLGMLSVLVIVGVNFAEAAR
jgi:hypothetical protein